MLRHHQRIARSVDVAVSGQTLLTSLQPQEIDGSEAVSYTHLDVYKRQAYTLSVGTIVEPGADTRTGYSIDWGDGTQSFTPAEWTAANGSFGHTYADGGSGGTAHTVTVSTTDEDGTFVLGTKGVTVANVAPTLALAGNAASNEGAIYTLAV